MAFPETGILDNFNRANTGPPPGPGWVNDADFPGLPGLETFNNECRGDNAADSNVGWWNTQFTASCEIYATISTLPANGEPILFCLREDAQNLGTGQGYCLVYTREVGVDTIALERLPVGSAIGAVINQDLNAGDSLGVQANGSVFYIYHKPAAGAWALLGTRTDSVFNHAGYIGLFIENQTARIDDLGGGNIVLPPSASTIFGGISMTGFTPAQTGFSRLWLTEGRARPDHKPSYESCHVLGGMDEDAGTPEPIKCPDPTRYGYFVNQGQILPVPSDPTTEITGRYAVDIASTMKRLKDLGCALDLQAHMGDCEDPMDFNKGFQKALIIEGARLTNWSTDPIGSVEEGAVVNETSAVTAIQTYEVLPLTVTERAEDTVVNAVRDVVICDRIGCGECDDESDGCQIVYALADASAGSPGTPGDVIFSIDGGGTWASNEIDTLDASEAPIALACLGQYVVVISNDSDSLHYKTKANINAGTVGGWTEVTTGFVAAGSPNDIWSVGTLCFICGDGGYLYSCADPTLGVTVLDAGITTTEDLYAIHAISEERVVSVGDNDSVVYTENGTEWQVGDATGGGGLNSCVWMHSEKVWFVGDDGGNFYYTLDKADNLTAKALPGSPSYVFDVAFSTQSVGYVVGINAAGTGGYAARTYDGGYSWVVLPEGPGSLPGTPGFLQALAACVEDANMAVFVGGVGTFGAATDGIILVGKD